jgi:hypothetical protein
MAEQPAPTPAGEWQVLDKQTIGEGTNENPLIPFAGQLAEAHTRFQEVHAQYMQDLQSAWTSLMQQYQELSQKQLTLQHEMLATMQKRLAESRPSCAAPVPAKQSP